METTATSKGQIVIPASVRRKFGIKEGTRIQIEVDEIAKEIILKPITREYVRSLRGKFRRLKVFRLRLLDTCSLLRLFHLKLIRNAGVATTVVKHQPGLAFRFEILIQYPG